MYNLFLSWILLFAITTRTTPRVTIVHVSPKDKQIEKAIQERSEKLKACGVKVEHIIATDNTEFENSIKTHLKPSTLVIVDGHGSPFIDPSNRQQEIFRWANLPGHGGVPDELTPYLPGRGTAKSKLETMLEKHSQQFYEPNKFLKLIHEKGNKSIFVDTCYSGQCQQGTFCVGTACNANELSFNGNAATERLTELMCSAAKDCIDFNKTDINKDGCVDGTEILNSLKNTQEVKKTISFSAGVKESPDTKKFIKELKKHYTTVEPKNKSQPYVQGRVKILYNQIRAEHKNKLLEPRKFNNEADTAFDPWALKLFPWIEEIEKKRFPSNDEAQKYFEILMQKNSMQFPKFIEFEEDGKAMVRHIKSVQFIVSSPKIEYQFETTQKSVNFKLSGTNTTVKTTPILGEFKLCWQACRNLEKTLPTPTEENKNH